MLKKTITYENFDGETVTEDFYFNLTQAEIIELNYLYEDGLEKYLRVITEEKNYKAIIDLYKTIIKLAYGKKSGDGRKFVKSEKASEEFVQSEAYSNLFLEILQNQDAAKAFMTGIIPKTANGSAAPPQIAAK